MNKSELFQKVDEIFRNRQQNNIAIVNQRIAEVSEASSALANSLKERYDTLIGNAKNNIGKNNIKFNINEYVKQKNIEIKKLLVQAGYPEDYLQPKFNCNVCKDEGVIYEPEFKKCECYINEYYNLLAKSDKYYTTEEQTFSSFDLNVFSNEIIPGYNFSQQSYMKKVFEYIQTYIKEYPNNIKTTKDLLFLGSSGLGKTFLMRAILNEFLEMNINVEYLSAYAWFEAARASYFSNIDTSYNNIMNAQVLLIDDLGTEPLMNNITVSQLFNVINERRNKGLHTILSTNLKMRELSERYTERIVSRWEDVRFCTIFEFLGSDIRKNIRKQ